jgi:hypothetical protein
MPEGAGRCQKVPSLIRIYLLREGGNAGGEGVGEALRATASKALRHCLSVAYSSDRQGYLEGSRGYCPESGGPATAGDRRSGLASRALGEQGYPIIFIPVRGEVIGYTCRLITTYWWANPLKLH